MSAERYRKKPVEVEAMQWSGSNWHEMLAWVKWEGHGGVWTEGDRLLIKAPEAANAGPPMEAAPGDWVIRGIAGEFYPCDADLFTATYELVV